MTKDNTEHGEVATIFSSDKFTINKDRKTMTTEASDIGQGFLGQAYDDAADRGFRMVSHKTSNSAFFIFSHTDETGRGEDAEVAGWVFVPTPKSVAANPTLKGWTVTVIND